MIRTQSIVFKALSVTLVLAVTNISLPIPALALATLGPKSAPAAKPEPKKPPVQSRVMTAKETKALVGRSGANPYLAGQNKWDIVYKGVNLMTGNYSMSATDLTFEGGYGIPVNVTRSYSANSPDEGPFGLGWSMSADIRSTAGGVLKSSSSPVRSVPVNFKERPTTELDPNLPSGAQPIEAVVAMDAGGKEETIQKDADGILTPPPWDKNVLDSQYELQLVGSSSYRVLVSNTVKTIDGTIYEYVKQGSYTGGVVPYNNSSASAEPSNILKPVSATDRQGNVTTYSYGSGWVNFSKSNGYTEEHPLTSVNMPNGRQITFNWGSGATASRITSVTDGVRTVSYGYTGGKLTSVTTPGGKTTSYGYGGVWSSSDWTEEVATNLLNSITDPRGLTTTIGYAMVPITMANGYVTNGPAVYKIINPNDLNTYFSWGYFYSGTLGPTFSHAPSDSIAPYSRYTDCVADVIGSAGGTKTNYFSGYAYLNGANSVEVNIHHYYNVRESVNMWTLPILTRIFDPSTQDLMSETSFVDPANELDLRAERRFSISDWGRKGVTTQKTYNFMGNPLTANSSEFYLATTGGVTTTRTAEVKYAYWGADKYFQQKAVKDQAGRYSYTDYYTASATAGKRGQTYRVYSPKYAGFTLNTSITPPAGTPSGNYWKYQLEPSNWSNYSAQFDYDGKGRATDVWKLQSATTSPWTYVQTKTTYGVDTTPIWGAATQVVEDYGGINRTTQTLAYDSIGRAIRVQDAKGQQFETSYDLDGVVQSVSRVDTSPAQTLVGYTYGTSGITNGQVLTVTDGLSNITQTMGYGTSGMALGQVTSVSETDGTVTTSAAYTYNSAGDRATSAITTPNGTARYGYSDYLSLGDPTKGARAFQTLNVLDSSGNPTAEEFHYQYDQLGRVAFATFAQTPQSGQSGYSNSYPAATRARAAYIYDNGGRLSSIAHYWDTWNGSSYSSEAILGNECGYEIGGSMNRGLKTSSTFYIKNPSNPSQFVQEWAESYGYDSSLDYLTSANYGDGQANATPSWTYDAAGNRNDATCDNLNRATSIGGVSRTYDILGNTLTKGSTTSMGWDALNRMTSFASSSTSASYTYRADGMRTKKVVGSTTTRFAYDGQMPIETWDGTTVTRQALGGRGIDWTQATTSSGSSISYPIYDGHGNNVAVLAKSGSGYTLSGRRSYGAWGEIRQGATSGGSTSKYCASLGHLDDDESGLTYMRARLYEAFSGRFVSEDVRHFKSNWFIYASNIPTMFLDPSGGSDESNSEMKTFDTMKSWAGFLSGAALLFAGMLTDRTAFAIGCGYIAFLALWVGMYSKEAFVFGGPMAQFFTAAIGGTICGVIAQWAATSVFPKPGDASPAAKVISIVSAYSGFLLLTMSIISMENGGAP